jgi:hypothetical protein
MGTTFEGGLRERVWSLISFDMRLSETKREISLLLIRNDRGPNYPHRFRFWKDPLSLSTSMGAAAERIAAALLNDAKACQGLRVCSAFQTFFQPFAVHHQTSFHGFTEIFCIL